MSNERVKGTVYFNKDGTAELKTEAGETITITDQDGEVLYSYLDYVLQDPDIFTEENRKLFEDLPPAERGNYIAELLEQFYRNNSEYAYFSRIQIYQDPLQLLEFFQAIKKSHFKKCGISLSSKDHENRFKRLQELVEEAEIEVARTPIDPDKLATIWPILRIRNLFTESELAALYYLQNPRTDILLKEMGSMAIPSGNYVFLADYVLSHAATQRPFKHDLTEHGNKKNDRGKHLYFHQDTESGFSVTEIKGDNATTITIEDKRLIQSTSSTKMLMFALAKASHQNFNGEIRFPLQELVEVGMYSSISKARTGVERHFKAIKTLGVGGKFTKGKKFVSSDEGILFYHCKIRNNWVRLFVDQEINIKFLASYYTVLPMWAWGLSNNAFELVLYIFLRSRTEKSGSINISFPIIRERLALPTKEEYDEKNAKRKKNGEKELKWKPGQYVKKPIISAINDIVNAIKEHDDKNITLDPHYIINAENLEEWMAGYLTVNFSGEYPKKLKQIQKNQARIIESEARKKEAALAKKAEKKGEKSQI